MSRSDTATTGTQIETAIRDIPQSVSVVKEEIIEAQSAFSLCAALKKMTSPKLKPIASVIHATLVSFAFAIGTAVFARSVHAQDEPGAGTRLLLQGTYQEDDFLPNPGFPLVRYGDAFRAPNVRRSLYFGVPNEDEENTKILVGIAQLEQELGDDWLASLRLNRTATRQRAGAENYAYGITPEGDTTLFASRLNQDNDVWSGEIRLNGNIELLGRPANVALGVDHTNFEFVNDQEYATLGIANIYEKNFDDFPTQRL